MFGKRIDLNKRTYATPKWDGPGVRMSKRSLSECLTRRKFSSETFHYSVKGRFGNMVTISYSLIGGSLSLYMVRIQNVIEHS